MILTETAVTPPPMPLSEFKTHLRLAAGFDNDDAEDSVLEVYLRAAIAAIEARIAQALMRRGFRLELACWDRDGGLTLPIGPVAAIDTLEFVAGETVVAQDATATRLSPGTSRQRLTRDGGRALPLIPAGHIARLEFQAGHGAAWAAVPADLRQAVFQLAARAYEDRAALIGPEAGLPAGVAALIAPHRPVRL